MTYPLGKAEAKHLVAESLLLGEPQGTLQRADGIGPCVVVMGAFDGLHIGHRKLVASAISDAREKGVPCVGLTFDPDPSEVVFAKPQQRLLCVSDRVRGLRHLGLDDVVVLSFDEKLAATEAEDFVRDTLMGLMKPLSCHVGSNFHFGAGGKGNVDTLKALGEELGFAVCASDLVTQGSERVSSTRIRGLLAEGGRLQDVNDLLGRAHFVSGVIEHGRGEGTSFGFPTANVRCVPGTAMPAEGVYGGYVCIDRVAWPAAINVGAPPTFAKGPMERFLEANLIGFSGNVYGHDAQVIFVEWLRPSRPFDSLEELERVVLNNIAWVQENLGASGIDA